MSGAAHALSPAVIGPTRLPTDAQAATLVGRVWNPTDQGPSPVLVRDGDVFDLSASFATMRDLCEEPNPARAAASAAADRLGQYCDILANTDPMVRDESQPWLLAPVDLQTLKAAGVTFAVSMVERVIEERVRGNVEAASRMRSQILDEIGTDLHLVKPGSAKRRSSRRS